MKTKLLLTSCLFGLSVLLIAQKAENECVQCTPNGFSPPYASVLGSGNNASGNSSVAGGQECLSRGLASISLGYQCSTSSAGESAIALGTISQANGQYSVALGHAAISSGQDDIAIGKFITSNH